MSAHRSPLLRPAPKQSWTAGFIAILIILAIVAWPVMLFLGAVGIPAGYFACFGGMIILRLIWAAVTS